MNLKLVASVFGINAKAFMVGWVEGHSRVSADGAPAIVPGSHFPAGSVEFAASQAAVAFYIAREGK